MQTVLPEELCLTSDVELTVRVSLSQHAFTQNALSGKPMPTPVDLDELLALVRDEQSFIRFVEALGADFASERLLEHNAPSSIDRSDSQEWENGTVDAFLDAAAAWAHASNRSPLADNAQSNVWQRCAAILFAGKFYE